MVNPSDEREFKPIRFRDWIFGSMCWETKGGFLGVLLAALLLFLTDLRIPGTTWRAGYAVLILAVIVLLGGLGRDCKLVYDRKRKPPGGRA